MASMTAYHAFAPEVQAFPYSSHDWRRREHPVCDRTYICSSIVIQLVTQ
jgi:hypothetical protein